MIKKVCILGLGYIGLPTAAILANVGYKVVGVDINPNVIKRIKELNIPYNEPGLKEILKKAIDSGNFEVGRTPSKADAFIIAVPTPLDKTTKKADLSYVRAAADSIIPYLERGNLVIIESTMPIGATRDVIAPILERSKLKAGRDFYIAYCPERVLPTKIIKELIENSRVIGGINEKSCELAASVYASFVKGKLFKTNDKTAEMVKLVENVYRDVNIALANELAKIAEMHGIDIWKVIELANEHPRVDVHQPGPGVGGHCIPLDGWFITEKAPWAKLIRMSRKINDAMPSFVVDTVCEIVPKNTTVTVFGVAYKGDVDDARETPAIPIIKMLRKRGYVVKVHDPCVKKFEYPLAGSLEEGVDGSELVILLSTHSFYNTVDIEQIGRLMKAKNLLDTRNFLKHKEWKRAGFNVRVLGKK